PEYCAQHARNWMVNVRSRKCRIEGCDKWPSFGVAGTRAAKYCAQHAPDEMVNVCSIKQRGTEGCGKWPSSGAAGSSLAECVMGRKKCRTQGCVMRPSFGVA
ncbi:unnamed protein product, partial [Ascophyllum nodosum]